MLITRRDLRMAFTAGLGNGFSYLSGIPFGYYVPLAVFATAGGTYGASLELGRQRILGTILGGALLYVSFWGLKDIPLALAIAITLGGCGRTTRICASCQVQPPLPTVWSRFGGPAPRSGEAPPNHRYQG